MCPIAHVPITHVPHCPCGPYPCTPLPMGHIVHVPHTPCTPLLMCPIPLYPIAPSAAIAHVPHTPVPHCLLCTHCSCGPLPNVGQGWWDTWAMGHIGIIVHRSRWVTVVIHTKLTIMTILASEALLGENKKNPAAKCYPSGHWTQDLSHLDLMLSSLSYWGKSYLGILKLSFVPAPLRSWT